jgi:hypothetical protein
MSKSKSPMQIGLNFMLILALLAIACNLSGKATPTPVPQPPDTQAPALPTQVTEAQPTAEPTTAATEEAVLPTQVATATSQPTAEPTAAATEEASNYVPDARLAFASFKASPVQVQTYASGVDTAPAWESVYNPFLLSDEQIAALQASGFVVNPGSELEFFTVYEKARYANEPIFVTSDALLHSYHLLFDKILRTAETEQFIPLLKSLNASMLAKSDEIYQSLVGTDWEADALRLVAFFGVGSKLLDGSVQIPGYAQALADAELANINAASGMVMSPLFPSLKYGEDYTQYIPRGHYTRSDALKAYFKSMMWYGRMTFILKGLDPAVARGDTRAAVLLVHAIRSASVNGAPALDAWTGLYSPTTFFVGRSDDLTIFQYGDVIDQVYGSNATLSALANESMLDTFITEASKLPAPKILGMVIQYTDNEEEATKGMRFMGQRFVPDAYIFRQLIFRNVGTLDDRRGLPAGLDLLAAMGSEPAYNILDDLGETHYLNYTTQMQKVRTWLTSLTEQEWTETLYNSWLYSFYPLLEPAEAGMPYFMQSKAWQDKQLNTVLGSWAELKHDTILYAKQVYAELGGGPSAPDPLPPQGYVEPVPAFYARLAALSRMTLDGLGSRGLLNELDSASLQTLVAMCDHMQVIAEKELGGQQLTEEDFKFIRFIGGQLEDIVMASADTDNVDPFAPKYMEEDPQAAVIADVATDPGSDQGLIVLEEGVGRIQYIYVVVPILQADGTYKWEIARGGVYSYYEFAWPGNNRLTDEKWRAMLDDGTAPDVPAWTGSFRVETGEYTALRDGAFRGATIQTEALWCPACYVDNLESYPLLQTMSTELNALKSAQQYIGHQLISQHFLSFDMVSNTQAVVTARETWQDTKYAGEWPDDSAPVLATRPVYEVIATYNLQLDANGYDWVVTQVSYNTTPPEWVAP